MNTNRRPFHDISNVYRIALGIVPPLFQVAVPPLLLLEGDCPYLPNIPKALFGLLQQNVPNPKGSEDILS